jgi:hypothetical protein
MNDVERFYERARQHFPGSPPWNKLSVFQQMQLIQGINMILEVLDNAD